MSDTLDQLRNRVSEAETAYAQVTQAPGELVNATTTPGGQPWNAWLIAFLAVLLTFFAIAVIHSMRGMLKEGHPPGDVLRIATMPMVITAAVFLVVLGFSNDQMTPVIGLLGTMIGYILGTASGPRASAEKAENLKS